MRKEKKFNKLVGRIGNEFYFCNDIFSYEDGSLQGATGTTLCPVSKELYEERSSQENVEELYADTWREMVASGKETRGLDAFVGDVLNYEGDEALFDFSGYTLWGQLRERGFDDVSFPVIECIGGGRCFGNDLKFDEVFDKDLLRKIRMIEAGAKFEDIISGEEVKA